MGSHVSDINLHVNFKLDFKQGFQGEFRGGFQGGFWEKFGWILEAFFNGNYRYKNALRIQSEFTQNPP